MIQRADDRSPRGAARTWKGRPLLAPSRETLALFVVALALRAAYAWLVHGLAAVPSSDSTTYDTIAWNLARGMGFQLGADTGLYPTAFVPPALPWALSLLYRATGHSFFAAVMLMCFFGALVPPLLRLLGRTMFGPAVGTWAGWLAAVHPVLIFFSGYVMTESLFSVALLLALLASVAWIKQPRAGRAFWSGVLWGAASLTRPTALPLALIVAIWGWGPLGLALAPGERRRQVSMLLLGLVLSVAPWTIRNAASLHAFVPITTGGGRSLLDSNNPVVWDDDDKRGGAIAVLTTEPWATRFRGLSEVELDRRSRTEALAFLRSRVAEWPRNALAKFARFWRWTALTPSTGTWSSDATSLASRLQRLDPLLPWSILFFPLAVWGLVRTFRGTRRHFQFLPLWVIAAATLGTLVYWGSLRLRVPIEPLVTLYAATGAADIVRRVRVRRIGLTLVSAQRS
jgi:4-amino-4-deoxy-L-arabinose transferase-like glycosyltransferase